MPMRQQMLRLGLIVLALTALVYLASSFLLPHKDDQTAVRPTADPTIMPTPQIVYILVAARDIRRGSELQARDVTIMGWPITDQIAPPLGAMVAAAPYDQTTIGQVIGRLARTDIIKNQPVLDYFLTPDMMPDALIDIPPTKTP